MNNKGLVKVKRGGGCRQIFCYIIWLLLFSCLLRDCPGNEGDGHPGARGNIPQDKGREKYGFVISRRLLGKCTETFDISAESASSAGNSCFAWFLHFPKRRRIFDSSFIVSWINKKKKRYRTLSKEIGPSEKRATSYKKQHDCIFSD